MASLARFRAVLARDSAPPTDGETDITHSEIRLAVSGKKGESPRVRVKRGQIFSTHAAKGKINVEMMKDDIAKSELPRWWPRIREPRASRKRKPENPRFRAGGLRDKTLVASGALGAGFWEFSGESLS